MATELSVKHKTGGTVGRAKWEIFSANRDFSRHNRRLQAQNHAG